MSEQIRLYSPDFSQPVFDTDSREAAHQFLRDSGEDSLGMQIDFGTGWKQRWAGHITLRNGCISYVGGSEFLDYMLDWPNPSLT